MSGREDMKAALERREPHGAVPIWEIEFQAWDKASGKHVVLGREFEALSAARQEAAMAENAAIMVTVAQEMNFAALTVPNAYWNHVPGQLAYYCLPGNARFRQLEALRRAASPDLMLIAITGGIMGADYSPEFCYRLLDDPAGVDESARNLFRRALEVAKRFRDGGAEAVVSPSDIADNSGPFFSPEQMRRWILPYLTQWAEAIHAMGMYAILHSDGNLTRYVDDIAATGVDALQAIDPVAGMDMRQTREIAGNRLCLCGNIDCGLLLRGQAADIFNATRDLLVNNKAGGGLVLGASNAVQPDVPIENYRAMVQAWRQFGQYGSSQP